MSRNNEINIKDVFADEDINVKRQVEVDFAKFICMMGMIFVHCFGTAQAGFSNYSGLHYFVGAFLSYTLGAGTYMFCMGVGISYSRRSNPKYMFIRGLVLIAAGYLLEFLKSGLVNIVVGAFFNSEYLADWYIDCLATNIFHFAGLFFIVYAIFKKLKIKDMYFLIFTVILGIIGSFFTNLNFNDSLVNHFVGLFLGTFDPNISFETHSYFPFFNWCLIPALGIFFGKILRRCKNKNWLYSRVSVIGLLLFAIYTTICMPNSIGIFNFLQNGFYHHSIFGSLANICACLMVYGIYFAIAKILPNGFIKFITTIAKNISFFYIIHFIIIKWFWIIPSQIHNIYYFDDTQVMLFALAVLLLTLTLTLLWNLTKKGTEKIFSAY